MSALPANYNAVVVHPETRMDHALYAFSAANQRTPKAWPNGAKVAIAVTINVDIGDLATEPMNVREFSYRDYGARVGVFRLMQILDSLGIKASLPINDAVLARTPAVAEAALKHGWELVAHGSKINRAVNSTMSEEDEAAYIAGSYEAIKSFAGTAPRGWLGPTNSESARTPLLLAKTGYDYTMDWGNDDQPFDFIVPQGRLSALPYGADTSDAAVIQAQSHTPWEFEEQLSDHLEGLLEDPRMDGSVMTLGLQAHVSGQPFRSIYIRKFLETALATGRVWCSTGSEIIDAYRGLNAATW
jgi:allantoinase